MRNLKKVLALVLALMMALSVMVFASANVIEDYPDADEVDAQYSEAVDVLTGMGIYEGDEGGFRPQDPITRAEVAALVYRVLTADVTNANVDRYVGLDYFDDVPDNEWYAGYVNYVANGKHVVGTAEGIYAPDDDITGFEVLTIMLRAIGYGKNGEFEGDEWSINVAQVADQLGISDGVKTSLNEPITREEVAYVIFEAVQQAQVVYTPAFGYQPIEVDTDAATLVVPTSSLGYENYGLDSKRAADVWGRPNTTWFNAKTAGTYAIVEDEDLHSNIVAETECDVAEVLGLEKTVSSIDVYSNGYLVTANESINPVATTAKLGAQGRVMEFYDADLNGVVDRIVYIDTYLAQVESVKNATFDDLGHLKTSSALTLNVYTSKNASNVGVAETVTLYGGATNYSYTKGQMLLVNAVDNANGDIYEIWSTDYKAYTPYHLDILQVATSIVGAQSKLWWNEEKHTIGGQDYNDAVCFYLDEAGRTEDVNHTWYFDQYHNLIGATDNISTNYAVLKNIQWISPVGSNGYAQATLVDLAGNESTVIVDSIDGTAAGAGADRTTAFTSWTADNFALDYTDNTNATDGLVGFASATKLFVSDELGNNTGLNGYAMYRVDTNLDGTVSLQGFKDNDPATDDTYVTYATNVNVTTGASALTTVSAGPTTTKVISVDNSTLFLVRTAATNTYTSYAGTAAVPSYTGCSVFYVDTDKDTIADYVYVKSGTPVTDNADHVVYITSGNYSKLTGSSNFVMENVTLDGVPGSKLTVTSEATAQYFAANVGKTFVVDFNGGVVAENDTPANGAITLVTSTKQDVEGTTDVIYLGDNVEVGNGVLISEYDDSSYYVGSTPVVVGENVALTTDNLNGYGVWVVYTPSVYNTVSYVYVGTALSEDAGFVLEVNNPAGTTIKKDASGDAIITLPSGSSTGTLLIEPNDSNAVIWWNNNKGGTWTVSSGSETIDTTNTDRLRVVSESGSIYRSITIDVVVKVADPANGAFNKIDSVQLTHASTAAPITLDIPTSYNTVAEAVNDPVQIKLAANVTNYTFDVNTVVLGGNTPTWGEIGIYGDKAAALDCAFDAGDFTSAGGTVAGSKLNSDNHAFSSVAAGNYVIIMTENNGEVAYHAYVFVA